METTILHGREVPATYLGDAVYAIYDGYNVWLRLDDHRNESGRICLEPSVLENLNIFTNQCRELRVKENERKEPENLAGPDDTQEG